MSSKQDMVREGGELLDRANAEIKRVGNRTPNIGLDLVHIFADLIYNDSSPPFTMLGCASRLEHFTDCMGILNRAMNFGFRKSWRFLRHVCCTFGLLYREHHDSLGVSSSLAHFFCPSFVKIDSNYNFNRTKEIKYWQQWCGLIKNGRMNYSHGIRRIIMVSRFYGLLASYYGFLTSCYTTSMLNR